MDIKCTTCGREVVPLDLYDGSWSCPVCRNPLNIFQSEFVVNADNEELFVQSELLFAQWLFNHDGRVNMSTVKQAIELCQRSARMGNPKAIARLAFYYDKQYVDKNYSDTMRCKIAYIYYSAICFSNIGTVKVENGLPQVNWKELREKTAYFMLYMLATAPVELQETKTYNLHNNQERVRHEMGLDINLAEIEKSNDSITHTERIFSTLCSCVDKRRAPLFGAFRTKIADLKDLYKRPFTGKENKIPNALYWLTTTKKILLAYIDDSVIKNSDAKFSRLSTRNSVEMLFKNKQDDDFVWIFFFNHNGGHKYLGNQQKRERVEKVIYGRVGSDLLKMLLQNGHQSSYVFYDDDIYQFMKQANIADATRTLIDRVCKGGGDDV